MRIHSKTNPRLITQPHIHTSILFTPTAKNSPGPPGAPTVRRQQQRVGSGGRVSSPVAQAKCQKPGKMASTLLWIRSVHPVPGRPRVPGQTSPSHCGARPGDRLISYSLFSASSSSYKEKVHVRTCHSGMGRWVNIGTKAGERPRRVDPDG